MLVRPNNGSALETEFQPPSAAKRGIRDRALELLQARSGWVYLAAVAFVLCVPALGLGLFTDDRILRSKILIGIDLFGTFELSQATSAAARNLGKLAWWSSPDLDVRFFRPLAGLLHIAEFNLWPDAAWAMHLVSNLVYVGIVVVAFFLYRELFAFEPRWAALAALMFAIDDGHAQSIGWISARNSLLATLFALTALLLHVRSRSYATSARVSQALGKQLQLHWASALAVALALLSAEAGIAVFAYLIAYAVAFEEGRVRDRVITLLPQLVVFVCWAIVYVAGGFGAHGTSFYRDLGHPFSLLAQGILDLPIWLASLFGPSFAGATMVLDPTPVRIVCLLFCIPVLYGVLRAVPLTRSTMFFALGMLLCLPALFTTQPQDRLLLSASFGAFGVIASVIATAVGSGAHFARTTRVLMIAFHLVLPLVLFVPGLSNGKPIDNGARALAAQIREKPAQQVVLLNSPIELISLYAFPLTQAQLGAETPKSLSIQQLYAGTSPVRVSRVDARTLELAVDGGWGQRVVERVFCAERELPRKDTKLKFDALGVWVVDADDAGHPVKVQFKFPDELESDGRLWLSWEGKKPVPWKPPAVGETVSLQPLNMFTSLEM